MYIFLSHFTEWYMKKSWHHREGETIGLYTTSGTLVATATAEGESTHLTVPTGQVYIVTVGDAVVKIGM